ncbi:type II toxin-antitoxin system RelE family toxin [Thalassiella azotivora]
MTYRVVPTASARRHLQTLPEAVAAAAIEFMVGPLAKNPHRVGKALRPPLTGRHSARRGQYRIVHVVDEDARTVTVLAVTHRRDAYAT